MIRGLYPLSPEIFPLCRDFLLAGEPCCVALVASLLENGKPKYPGIQSASFAILAAGSDNGDLLIEGVIFNTPGGSLLHRLLPAARDPSYRDPLALWLRNRRVLSILGTRDETCFLETLLAREPERAVEYELMTIECDPPAESAVLPALSTAISEKHTSPYIRLAHPGDAELLLSLQLGYEKEEVLAPGTEPDKDHTLPIFRTALSRQDVYAAFYNREPVAKAGTNARGLNWDQLGGIYTKPEYRAKGIASALVAHVVHTRTKLGKNTVLFVKTGNIPAKRVYQKTGFTPLCGFRIVYY